MKKILEQDVKPEIRYSAAGLIMRTGDGNVDKILMIQRAKNDYWPHEWEFPRGGCEKEKDKSLRECAVREIKEEVGLDVRPTQLLDKYKYVRYEGTKKIITYCYNYKCKLLNPNQEVRLSKEHQSYKWISEVGEVELMATPEQKKTIQKVLNNERSIVSYPRHKKTEENVNFYLKAIQEDPVSGILAGTAAGATGVSAGGMLAGAAAGLLPAYFSILLIKMAADIYKNNFTKAAKKCKGYGAGEKQICMLRAQITGKKAALNKIQTNIDKCSKAKSPEECRAKLSQKIQTMQQEIGYLLQREKELRGKA